MTSKLSIHYSIIRYEIALLCARLIIVRVLDFNCRLPDHNLWSSNSVQWNPSDTKGRHLLLTPEFMRHKRKPFNAVLL